MGFFDNDNYGYDGSYSSIDESTITMPLYNNRYSNISDMYEVACQLEIDGNDLIHEMEMNILMNEHNYFVEHGRAVQYSDGYGYLTEEGNSVWRFIQKMWETLMKYLDQCVSWVIDKCKEWILYFRQAWAKWGMKDGLKGILKKIEENVKKIEDNTTDKSKKYEFTISLDNIPGKTMAYMTELSKFIGGKAVDFENVLKAWEDLITADASTRKSNNLVQKYADSITNLNQSFKVIMDIAGEMKTVKDMAFNGDSASDIKSHYKERFEAVESSDDDSDNYYLNGKITIYYSKGNNAWYMRNESNNANTMIPYSKLKFTRGILYNIQNMGLVAYNILQKDLSESLGKVFEKIREGKKEIRQDRIDNRADDGDKEKFNQLKVVIKGYNMLASFAMKLFSRGLSACAKVVNVCTKCLKKVNEDLKSEADKLKTANP